MATQRLRTRRLELLPLAPAAAAALPEDRDAAERIIGAELSSDWPQPDLLDVLPRQAAATPDQAPFGIWILVEQETGTVVGDVGFFGPPKAGTVEIGYSVVPDRRRRGYVVEAGAALITWVRGQPGVTEVVAGCEEDNQASMATLERLGFTRLGSAEGQLRWRYG